MRRDLKRWRFEDATIKPFVVSRWAGRHPDCHGREKQGENYTLPPAVGRERPNIWGG